MTSRSGVWTLAGVVLAGCGGANYEVSLDPPAETKGGAATPAPSASSAWLDGAAAPDPSPLGEPSDDPSQRPVWETREVPEVVPYEPLPSSEPEDGRPVDPGGLPAGFFTPASPPAPSATPTSPSLPTGTAAPPSAPPGAASNPSGAASSTAASSTAASSTAASVRLSTGVALAQTLPTGSAMGFSVRYVFNAGYDPQGRYMWVIKPPKGAAVGIPVRLQQQGELNQFVTQWPPQDGTYDMQLQQLDARGQPRPISRAIQAYYAQ